MSSHVKGNSKGPTARRPGKAGGKRDVNRRKRRQQLLDAGLGLLVKKGLQSVTIEQIVTQAGLAKGSFYRYFKDKEALVEGLLSPLASQIVGALETCDTATARAIHPRDLVVAYEKLAAQLVAAVIVNAEVVRLYLQESRGPAEGARRPLRALADQVSNKAAQLTTVAMNHGLLRRMEARVSALAVIGAAERLSFALLSGESLGPLDEVAQELVSMVLRGLTPP